MIVIVMEKNVSMYHIRLMSRYVIINDNKVIVFSHVAPEISAYNRKSSIY